MNSEEYRYCNKCTVHKPISDFHLSMYTCKSCRSSKYESCKQSLIKDKIKSRIHYRNELFKEYISNGGDLNRFNKLFIPFEKYEQLKGKPDSSSYYSCSHLRNRDKLKHATEYDKKYFIDVALCSDSNKGYQEYVVHII